MKKSSSVLPRLSQRAARGDLGRAFLPVLEKLEGRCLMSGDTSTVQTLPFTLNFDAAVPGTIADTNGEGTGFTFVQANKNVNEYQPALIDLQTANSVLKITTTGTATAGGSWESDNTLVDALATTFNASSGAFTMTTRLKGPLDYLANPSQQGGILFGPGQDNYVKFVAVSQPSGQMLQFVDEQKPAGASGYTHSITSSYTSIGTFASINTLDLRIIADATTGTVSGAYAINGGAFTNVAQQVTLTGAQKTLFFSSTARSGLIAMAKNNLPPVAVSFDSFAIDGTTVDPDPGGKLTGAVIGTPGSYGNKGNTIAKVFDGSLNSYFDSASASGSWAGLDLGTPKVIAQIKYAPRSGYGGRMVGGIFQGSSTADFTSGVVNLFTVSSAPTSGSLTSVTTGNASTFRYVRYLSPNNSYGNVAEAEFFDTVTVTENPSVATVSPANGATTVLRTAFVSCDLNLPNGGEDVGGGIDVTTLTKANVYLVRTFDGKLITAALNTDGAGSVIILQPDTPLDASTSYTFVVTAGVKDVTGATFVPFQMSFTTGSESITTDPSIAFEKVTLTTAVNQPFTGLVTGPDGKLYASTASGSIYRFPINLDGTLGNPTVINTVMSNNGGARLITGIAFDPAATANNPILWVSHGVAVVTNAADWTGKISRLSGANLGTYQDYVVGLPRSIRDHVNNQPIFGPDGALYWGQGAMSAMGGADPVWGMRPEHLLSAAILRLNINANATWPINAKTEDLTAGQTAYNPYAANAPLTIYATGVRNSYDMVWAENGHLYVPTNGSAGGGNTPAGPGVPALTNIGQAENDWLFDVEQGGYYGHPNPTRNEFVMNGGNPSTPGPANFPIQGKYPVGINPDPNYKGILYDLGVHYSPNGVIQYSGSAFNGVLDGALLITRYSGGKDILLVRLNASGQVVQTETGIAGFTQFTDPIDLTEDTRTGYLYVAELGGLKLTLLRPINSGAAVSVDKQTLYFNDPVGGGASPAQSITITNTGNQPLALPSDGISIIGAEGALFPIVSKPSLPTSVPAGGSITLTIAFNAGNSALGLHAAKLQIKSNDATNSLVLVDLRGLTTAGVGGNNEPSLQRILDLFQIPISVGTPDAASMQLPTPPQLPNDELTMPRLRKAGPGNVTIEPLAAMSVVTTPSAGIGWYLPGTYDSRTTLFTINAADAQSVNPTPIGTTSFDPGTTIFGLFASFDAFLNPANGNPRIAYGEDMLNTWDTSGNTRKVRFYPLKNSDGSVVPDAFVFATEDYGVAPNYESNDVVGIIRNVQAAPAGAEIGTQNLDTLPFPDRMVFNKVQVLNATKPNVVHNKGTLRIFNTGTQALSISGINSSSTFFTTATTGGAALSYPLNVPANSFLDIVVTYNPTHSGGTKAFDNATLTILSNAVNSLSKQIQLSGVWQSASEANPEPSVKELISAFGYATNTLNSGEQINQSGKLQTVGEEVLSRYWKRADVNLPVTARQLAAFHTQGNPATLYWFSQGSPTGYNKILANAGNDSQSVLPQADDATHAPAFATFTTNNVFGFNVDKLESSDDTLNSHANANDQGHHVRFWPARDRAGKIIANTWLMAMDYSGINYDYNDNIYLIANMRPAPPATPTGLAAIGSGTGIALSWTAVSAPLLAGYNVYRSTSSGGTYTKLTLNPVSGTAYNDVSATPGGTFYYKISALDTWEGESGLSAVASATRPADNTPPAPPASLTATPSGAGITLDWADSVSVDLAGYNVYRSTSAGGTFFKLNASLLTGAHYVDVNAPAGQASFYQVKAVDFSGNLSTPATASATRLEDNTAPAPPAGFGAASSGGGVMLSWSANVEGDLAGYNLYRSNSSNGVYTKRNSTPLTGLSFNDTTAPLSFPSFYRLQAIDFAGNESTASTASGLKKDGVKPDAPANLTASANSTGITLNWDANTEADLAGYNVFWSSSAGGPFTLLNTDALLTNPTYIDTAAPVGTTSFYRVVALDYSGNVSDNATASATRNSPDITPPAKPTGFTAAPNAGTISLSWFANTEVDLAGYNLYRSASAGGPWTPVNIGAPITDLSYVDTSAPAGQTSFYQLKAVDKSNNESIPATANAALPSQSFTSSDIGSPTPIGSTTTITNGSAYDVEAGGSNIFGTADQFRFVYKQITGNFDIKVQIASLTNGDNTTSSFARAGLMARTNLTAGSANVFSYNTPGPNGYSSSYRLSAGATTTATGGPANSSANRWVRLVRSGNTFTSYASSDGTAWTQIAPAVTVSLGQTLYVGMAATSHNPDKLVTAKFRSFMQV